MKDQFIHQIKYVARVTGLKPHLIRAWEERYGVVAPERTRGNRRLYSDEDIRRLARLKAAVDAGHTISAAASLDVDQLEKIAARAGKQNRVGKVVEADAPDANADGPEKVSRRIVQAALSHVTKLDAGSLEKTLDAAAVSLSRQSFLQFVIVPLFQRLGDLWRDGKVRILHEHMASTVVRSMLWDMLRETSVSDTAPSVFVATPAGDRHEIGALASALAASESGWQAVYYGPDLPSEEIVFALRCSGAKALYMSLCHRLDVAGLVLELKKIRRLAGDGLPIFVGGAGAIAVQNRLDEIGAYLLNDLQQFRDHLEALVGASRPES